MCESSESGSPTGLMQKALSPGKHRPLEFSSARKGNMPNHLPELLFPQHIPLWCFLAGFLIPQL